MVRRLVDDDVVAAAAARPGPGRATSAGSPPLVRRVGSGGRNSPAAGSPPRRSRDRGDEEARAAPRASASPVTRRRRSRPRPTGTRRRGGSKERLLDRRRSLTLTQTLDSRLESRGRQGRARSSSGSFASSPTPRTQPSVPPCPPGLRLRPSSAHSAAGREGYPRNRARRGGASAWWKGRARHPAVARP